MRKIITLSMTLVILLLGLVSSSRIGYAQVPSFGGEWPIPPAPSGYYSWQQLAYSYGYSVSGEVTIGGIQYLTRVLDRTAKEKDPYTQNDQPFYCEISVPADALVNWVVGIIEYHPPNYAIAFLLPGTNRFIGTAGSTTRIGPFARGTADPEGKYAWRIGIMALIQVAAGTFRWFWGQSILYYNYGQIPKPQPVDFALSVQNPVPLQESSRAQFTSATLTIDTPSDWKGETILVSVSAQAGIIATLSRSSVTRSDRLTISIQVPENTKPGQYSIGVRASGGGMTHDESIQLVVIAPPPPVFDLYMIGSIVIAALIMVGILAVFLMTRRRPATTGYRTYPVMPQPSSLKPGVQPAIKPQTAHIPRVIGRREEKK